MRQDGLERPDARATGATPKGPFGDALLPMLALALSICLAFAAAGIAVLHLARQR